MKETKHVEIDCHYVRDQVKQGLLTPSYVSYTDQVADILTKVLVSSSIKVICTSWELLLQLTLQLEGNY